MKKVIFLLLSLILLISNVLAVSIERNLPERVSPGENLVITFNVKDVELNKKVVISDVIPEKFEFISWNVNGAKELKDDIEYQLKEKVDHRWSFTSDIENPSLTYIVKVPSDIDGQKFSFDAVYMLPPANMGNLKSEILVAEVKCGDGICDGDETEGSCPEDCKKREKLKGAGILKIEKKSKIWIYIIIITIIILVVLFFYLTRSRKTKKRLPKHKHLDWSFLERKR